MNNEEKKEVIFALITIKRVLIITFFILPSFLVIFGLKFIVTIPIWLITKKSFDEILHSFYTGKFIDWTENYFVKTINYGEKMNNKCDWCNKEMDNYEEDNTFY